MNNCPECNSEEYKFVSKPFDNGNGFHVRMQCFTCGYLTSKSFKKELNGYPSYDAELFEKYQDDKYLKFRQEYSARTIGRQTKAEVEYAVAKQNWHRDNDLYYMTPEWKKKKEYVLKRDGYLCQMCLTNRAYTAHHLNYSRFKNELTSDLISVCRTCHMIIHNINLEEEPF